MNILWHFGDIFVYYERAVLNTEKIVEDWYKFYIM